jgi:energy-coupling factor transport system ATP-binding protein
MIRVNNVSYSYSEEVELVSGRYALRNVTLDIPGGAYVAFMGSNGSGKSTLARMMNGLLKPMEGFVTVDGLDTRDVGTRKDLRRIVQLVFQNPENQIVGVTLEDDIAFGLSNIGYPQRDMPMRIEWALKQVGLDGRQRQSVFELSGGEKQKLALASVLALSPRYIILDEATSMLDTASREQFLQTLHLIRASMGFGLIHITHHFGEVWGAEHLVLFRDGVVESAGTPEYLLNDPDLLAVCGIELPYLAQISANLRRGGVDLPLWPTEEELIRALCRSN